MLQSATLSHFGHMLVRQSESVVRTTVSTKFGEFFFSNSWIVDLPPPEYPETAFAVSGASAENQSGSDERRMSARNPVE